MLAIEWIWILIGSAAVFAHLVEAWAMPYLPALWMVGVLTLFLVYRLGVAVRQLYWPEPEIEESAAPSFSIPGTKLRGGDGMISTTEWVPPHIRGRKAPTGRSKRKKAQTPPQGQEQTPGSGPLELPSASGRYDGAEIATVFAEVDDDTDPVPSAISDVAIPFDVTSIVELDEAELRPETEADLSQDDLVIPAFAESALTREERLRALQAAGDSEPTLKRSAPQRPGGKRAAEKRPAPKRSTPEPLAADEPTETRPGPKRPSKNQPAPKRPMPKRPMPKRPTPEPLAADEPTETRPGPKKPPPRRFQEGSRSDEEAK